MKKIIITIASAASIFGVAACGNMDDAKYSGPLNSAVPVDQTVASQAPALDNDELFISMLEDRGFPFPSPKSEANETYIEMAGDICSIIDVYGYSETVTKVQGIASEDDFLTQGQAKYLVTASSDVYCPASA